MIKNARWVLGLVLSLVLSAMAVSSARVEAPLIIIVAPTEGQEILAKYFTVFARFDDPDVECRCVASAELWIDANGRSRLLERVEGDVSLLSYLWDAGRYRNKGPVSLRFVATDVEGLTTEETVTVTASR